MPAYTLYCHKNKANGKEYYGITCQEPKLRWKNGHGYRNNAHFYSAIEMYGWDGFDHIIMYEGITKELAELLEIKLIAMRKTYNREYGYNGDRGGKGHLRYETEQERQAAHEESVKRTREKIKAERPDKIKEWQHKANLNYRAKNLEKERERVRKYHREHKKGDTTNG